MKEKLGTAMMLSVGLMIVVLLLALFFPQLIEASADPISFAKGTGAALVSCLAGVIAAFKYNKNKISEKTK